MATPEITLRGELRGAVIDCVVRDAESSLDAVRAGCATALQTLDYRELLDARAQARGLADALELLARLIDPERAGEDSDTDDQDSLERKPSKWDDVDRAAASSWIEAEAVSVPDFLQVPRSNGDLTA